jgi:hypothetical protein
MMTARATDNKHPAPFTESIIEALSEWIPVWVPEGNGIHDPFAGDGRRLGALCDRLGFTFTGTDLEDWRDSDERVIVGNSRHTATYPAGPHAIVTSPTYNNGVNDHFKPKDTSRRLTYRVAAGHALHEDNTGRYSGRGSKRAEYDYWRISNDVVFCWPDLAIVNVKDSTRNGETYPLVQKWIDLLRHHGYAVGRQDVACPGWRFGTNRRARSDTEAILLASRDVKQGRRHA